MKATHDRRPRSCERCACPRLERDGEVLVLHLAADNENRFHFDCLTAALRRASTAG